MTCLPAIFSKANLRFIELLAGEQLSVRELAERTNCSPAKASQAVKQFQKQGLAITRMEKNRKIVRLNSENPLAKRIVSLLFVEKILNSKAFKEMKKKTKAIGVYGSIAEGTVDKLSDIDLWILSDKKISMVEAGEMRNSMSRELGKEVSIKAFTKESLEELKQKDKLFFSEIEYKSVILHGLSPF